jgi:adenosylcobinamide-GDP ribazoletransferase
LLGILAAFQFLTVLPVKRGFTSEQVGRSSVYFPVVGAVIGLVLAGLNRGLGYVLPEAVVNIILLTVLAAVSGGLHLDGLADTLDGLAGHRTAEERLAIMKDSRIGGFGAIGLALTLLIEYVTLSSIPANIKVQILILAPVLSRWAMVNSIFVYPYARPHGLGKAYKDAVNLRHFIIASLFTLAISVVLFRWSGLIIMAGTWLVIALLAEYFKKHLKGLTGDTYGAINEISFIAALFFALLLAYNHWLI